MRSEQYTPPLHTWQAQSAAVAVRVCWLLHGVVHVSNSSRLSCCMVICLVRIYHLRCSRFRASDIKADVCCTLFPWFLYVGLYRTR